VLKLLFQSCNAIEANISGLLTAEEVLIWEDMAILPNIPLDEPEKKIMEVMRQSSALPLQSLAKELNQGDEAIAYHCFSLVEKGLLEKYSDYTWMRISDSPFNSTGFRLTPLGGVVCQS
jgi:hypothetical protein